MNHSSDPGRPSGSMHTGMRAVRSPFIDWSSDVASWMDDGLCIGSHHPDMWFADHRKDIEAAKTICHGCPVERLCLERSLKLEETGAPWGVWGGKSAEERNQIRKARRETPAPIVVGVGTPRDAA